LLFKDDYGITWKFDFDNTQWDYLSGLIEGNLSAIPTLGAEDTGAPFRASDYKHKWIWSGSAWAYDPADEGSGFIRLCHIAPETGLWQICDGSTVNRSNSDGSVTSVTVPDYGTSAYIKAGTSATLGPTAASGDSESVSAGTPAGSVGAIAATGTAAVQRTDTGVDTAGQTHTHPAPTFTGDALAGHDHGPGTLELRRTQLIAYYRR
jgi:hypothetical protein